MLQTDNRQTDIMQSQYRAMHNSTSCGKNENQDVGNGIVETL